MKQIELFAGIGGFGLAGHWAGILTVCQVEIDSFCQKVLQKNFPNAERHGDIHTFNGEIYAGQIDIISGGFPCQPYSTAGKRLGKNDARHLWPEMLRVIREVRPRWVVGENVGGIISWSDGLVFEEVCADLENEGYEVQPFVLPACGVNAPHRRDRVWFVAKSKRNVTDSESERRKEWEQYYGREDATEIERRMESEFERFSNKQLATNSDSSSSNNTRTETRNSIWDEWTFEPPLCRVDDGVSGRLDRNWNKQRKQRIKALGNAIVPQVAYQIFSAIIEYETKF